MARSKSTTQSSSSDEDDSRLAQLREATVTFDNLKKECKKNEETSLKILNDVDEKDSKDFSLEVTPEFQDFVAKKLKAKLDEYEKIYLCKL